MEIINQFKQELISKFIRGNFKEPINLLENRLPTEGDKYFDFILLANELKELNRESLQGITYYEQLQVRKNQIRKKILEFIRGLNKHDFFGYTNEDGIVKFKDGRDGQSYEFVEILGETWLTQNLNYDTGEGCWFYDDNSKNGLEYGRLYDWFAAQEACIPGWRLPTPDDINNLHENIDEAFKDRKYKDKIEFYKNLNLSLSGWKDNDGQYNALDGLGYYWASSYKIMRRRTGEVTHAHFFKCSQNRRPKCVESLSRRVSWGLACRCIKEN